MNRRTWLWAALLSVPAAVVGGFAYANSVKSRAYTCPITGEQLPCPKCCPLNGEKGQATTGTTPEEPKPAPDGYICPITAEKLGCPNCCPLNESER